MKNAKEKKNGRSGRRSGKAASTVHRLSEISLAVSIRNLRMRRSLSGAELCRKAGDLDPKTLTAVEKGRIRNPSIQTLQSISRGLGVTIADLFREAELGQEQHLYHGNQKGSFQLEFSRQGVKVISFTPLIPDFFCGKLILSPQAGFDESLLSHPVPIFVSPLIGKFEVDVEGRKVKLTEGENLFFNGGFRYRFYNPLHRDAVLLLVTAPSVFKGSGGFERLNGSGVKLAMEDDDI